MVMKIIEFEPGDGTRYFVGIEPIDLESSRMLGWAQPAYMFYFGPGDAAKGNVVGIKATCSTDMEQYLGLKGYTASAAACVFAELIGIESFGLSMIVTRKWDEIRDNPLGHWRDQLKEIKVSL